MGLPNAARIFASIYGHEMARQHFHLTEDNMAELNLATSTSLDGIDKIGADLSSFVSKLNKGMMSQMQGNPGDTLNDCYKRTTEYNVLLLKAFDFKNVAVYTTGEFDVGTLISQFQVSAIKFAEQLDGCGYNKFLIAFDSFANNLPQLVSAGANMATQLGTGF